MHLNYKCAHELPSLIKRTIKAFFRPILERTNRTAEQKPRCKRKGRQREQLRSSQQIQSQRNGKCGLR